MWMKKSNYKHTHKVASLVNILISFNLLCAFPAHTGFWKALITCVELLVRAKLGTGRGSWHLIYPKEKGS